jgi:uncharacterized protein YegL
MVVGHLIHALSTQYRKAGSQMNEDRLEERMATEEGRLVMPFYLLCDVSASMHGDMPALNEGVRRLRRAVVNEPVVDDVAQVSIISFSDDAKVVVPMGPMSECEIPELTTENLTNYGKAFQELARRIEEDSAKFRANGYKIYRPCAFFLTDGLPSDRDWHKTFINTLTYDRQTGRGMKAHPIFVPFGFRQAREDVLMQLAYPLDRGRWYHSSAVSIEQVLKGVLDIIMNTIITSGRSAGAGQPTLSPQAPDPGSDIEQGRSRFDPDYNYDPDYV